MADFTPSLDGTSLASTSTAPSHGNNNCCVYDVFLNHCGPDVKKGLATHIYYRLKGLGLAVFLDQQELERGDGLNAQIEGAIRTASVHVAIFSRRYAQSNWCLDELVQMLESGSAIIPVSYKVGPADLLIILDDIDHMDQMDALCAPVKDTIDVGSLILITSRNNDVLISAGIGNGESSIYTLKGINPEDSQELFCWHAFGQPRPVIGFEEVVKKFLHVCNGLPLSLKVRGALLRGKNDLRQWSAQLRKTSKVLPDDIRSRLRINYDALDEEEKHI